jgi:hypothetical protein
MAKEIKGTLSNIVTNPGGKLPRIEQLGIMRVTDGPPLPISMGIKWPSWLSKRMKEQWPGVPFPREWGEKTMKYLPSGVGTVVNNVIDSLGL